MFGNDSQPSKIFSFGALPPIENSNVVDREMFDQHCFYNDTITIEIRRWEKSTEMMRKTYPEVVRIEDDIDEIQKKIDVEIAEQKKVNADARSRARGPDSESRRERISALKDERKARWDERKKIRGKIFATSKWKKLEKPINDEAYAAYKALSAKSSVYWGSKAAAKEAVERARRDSLRVTGGPPHHKKWVLRSNWQLMTQIQHHGAKGLHVNDLVVIAGGASPNPLVYAVPSQRRYQHARDADMREDPGGAMGKVRTFNNAHSSDADETMAKALDKYGPDWDVFVRVQSDGGKPVFAKFPVVFHRAMPSGAIKRVYIIQRRVGTHYEWAIQFVVAQKQGFRKQTGHDGEVQIHPVSRLDGLDVVVAELIGSDGWRSEVRLGVLKKGHTFYERMKKVDDLQEIRKRKFNSVRGAVASWARANKAKLPKWWHDDKFRTATMHAWQSPSLLAVLVTHWRDNRFKGDDDIWTLKPLQEDLARLKREKDPSEESRQAIRELEAALQGIPNLEEWRRKDKHLYDYECHQRTSTINARDNLFRIAVSNLAKRYKKAIVPGVSLTVRKKKAKPEDEDDPIVKAQRRINHVSAPGRLLAFAKERFAFFERTKKKKARKVVA